MFLVFAYNHLPKGGYNDFKFSCKHEEQLKDNIKYNKETCNFTISNVEYSNLIVTYLMCDGKLVNMTDIYLPIVINYGSYSNNNN